MRTLSLSNSNSDNSGDLCSYLDKESLQTIMELFSLGNNNQELA